MLLGGHLLAAALVAALVLAYPQTIPWGAFLPILVVAGVLLAPADLAVVTVVTVTAMLVVRWRLEDIDPALDASPGAPTGIAYWGEVVVALVVAAVMWRISSQRTALGLQGSAGNAMIVDLRDRLRANGNMPDLPAGWHTDVDVHSAHGDAFSGDFLITALSADGGTFEVALVDVSGKGAGAATRALLLSGALSGLLGATDPAGFLPSANAYLLRQRWVEGFATAIHVAIDLRTGAFSLGNAGHPPAAKFFAGSGRWDTYGEPRGPVLGVVEGMPYPRHQGRLSAGDALILVTDGIIETPGRDLNDGIDRMLGTAETLVSRGFRGGAARLCQIARAGDTDDRAAVIIWR